MARKRNYKAEYQHRIERGLARGLSRPQARGHRRPDAASPELEDEMAAVVRDFHPVGFRLMAKSLADTDTSALLSEIRAGLRQSLLSSNNRHATHPINAMLNYAYAVLETEVRKSIAESGLDPTIGYLHVREPGRLSLVYDLMEPLRPRTDKSVVDFVKCHAFSPMDFVTTSSGECRLCPELAACVAAFQVNAEELTYVVKLALDQVTRPKE